MRLLEGSGDLLELAVRLLGAPVDRGADADTAHLERLLDRSERTVRQHAVAIYLDPKNRPLGWRIVSIGTDVSAPVKPLLVLQPAVLLGANAMIFAHNPPSGVAEPSQSDLRITQRLKDALALVDAVTSLGGSELKVDEWGIDAIYSGTQKCLSCPPGLSPVSFSPRAIEKMDARKSKVQSWYLDVSMLKNYYSGGGGRAYHHTAPITAMTIRIAGLPFCKPGKPVPPK